MALPLPAVPPNAILRANCHPPGHPEYSIIQYDDIYTFPCSSLCVVTEPYMNYDLQKPHHPPQDLKSKQWRRMALNITASPPGGDSNPLNRFNTFDGYNDLYYAFNGPNPVNVGSPGRVTHGGGLTNVATSIVMVTVPYNTNPTIGIKRAHIKAARGTAQKTVLGPAYTNALAAAIAGHNPPGAPARAVIAPAVDILFPPIGCSTGAHSLDYTASFAADAAITAVVGFFAGGNDPTGQITSVKWILPASKVVRSAWHTYFKRRIELAPGIGHNAAAPNAQVLSQV